MAEGGIFLPHAIHEHIIMQIIQECVLTPGYQESLHLEVNDHAKKPLQLLPSISVCSGDNFTDIRGRQGVLLLAVDHLALS